MLLNSQWQEAPGLDFVLRDDGLLTERSAQELAAWYTNGGDDAESFEAHLMLLNAHASLMTSAQRGRKSGLSRERYDVLRALYRAPGYRIPLSELGRSLNVSPASITKLINGLSRAQLAHRTRFADDKRRMWAELTPKGVAAVEESLPIVVESTKRRWQGLTKRRKARPRAPALEGGPQRPVLKGRTAAQGPHVKSKGQTSVTDKSA